MCDGDVNRLSGLGFYDRSVAVGADTAKNFKAAWLVWGTNHNGYNTQWQTDDNYQASSHTCPGQTRIFPHPLGLSSRQQVIGRYFLMALARSTSQAVGFTQMFNTTFFLPPGLANQAPINRSFFLGTNTAVRRILRFDGTCSSKFSVTTGVQGNCFTASEHDASTWIGRVRWNQTGRPSNAAIFTLNNGVPINLTGYQTLDMRVGPDCFLYSTSTLFACGGVSPTGGPLGSQGVVIYLRDSSGRLSRPVNLADYAARRPAIGISVPSGPGPGDVYLPIDPLYHAILSSTRIPLSAFAKTGFSMSSVRSIYVALGNGSRRGGLYFGDVSALTAARGTLVAQRQAEARSDELGLDEAALPSLDAILHPATPGKPDAVLRENPSVPATRAVADQGHRIESVRRGRLPSAVRLSDDGPDKTPMGTTSTVEFTLSTPEPIIDIGGAGLSVVIGGRPVRARFFGTGVKTVAKLVVPAAAVDAAADGASLAVVGPTRTWRFGALRKSMIR
jgi:hypothetical protein